MNTVEHVTIVVSATVDEYRLYCDDIDVAGTYEVAFHRPLPESMAANAALDVFHTTVPIKVLDDFDIEVQGFEEDPDIEAYTLEDCGDCWKAD